MHSRQLGKNLTVSAIGFGGASLSGDAGGYGFGAIPDEQAIELLQFAYEKGVTLFDTAPIYGFGTSEKRIGAALSGKSSIRKNITLVSKCGVSWDADRNRYMDNSPKNVKRMLFKSLEYLKTEYLDLYMIHWNDPKTPVEKTMEELLKAKSDGLIKNIGACNFNLELLERAFSVGEIDVIQNPFSLMDIESKKDLFTFIKQKNIGFMSYGTLGKGVLTGRVNKSRQFEASDIRSIRGPKFMETFASIEHLLEKFFSKAKELGLTPAELALAWVLSHEELGVALCGSRSIEQLQDLLNKVDYKLPPEVKKELDNLSENILTTKV